MHTMFLKHTKNFATAYNSRIVKLLWADKSEHLWLLPLTERPLGINAMDSQMKRTFTRSDGRRRQLS